MKGANKKSSIILCILLSALILFSISNMQKITALDTTSIEDFEDDTAGSNPSDTWYTYTEVGDATMEVSDTNESTWTKTFYFNSGSSQKGHAYFNFSSSTPNNIAVDVYPVEGINVKFFFKSGDTIGNGFRLKYPDFCVWNNSIDSSGLTTIFSYENGEWLHVNFTLNFTTHQCRVIVNGTDYGWYNFGNNINDVTCIEIQETSAVSSGEAYFDNITIYFTPSSNYPPSINDTALQNSLTNGRITWSGQAGETVWCNSSGEGYETLNITIIDGAGANDTDVTEIRIWVGDLNDTSYTITADNIELYASVDGTTWHSFGTFPSGGGNISLNSATWTWSDNPFPISGDDTIYCRFKLTIPADTPSDTYFSASATEWKIYLIG